MTTTEPLRIWNQLGPETAAAIRAAAPDVEVIDIDVRPRERPAAAARILFAQPLYASTADEVADYDGSWAADVEWVQVPSAGVDKVPPSLLRAPIVTCGRGVMSGPIAEFVLGAILARHRGIPDVFVERPTPTPGPFRDLTTFEGSTLGLLGFGSIAQAIAVRAIAFGAEVIATRRSARPAEVEDVTIVDLHELIARSDALVVAAPATDATAALLDRTVLKAVKPGVHIINIARGSLIDQDALLEVLDDGVVGHATLDVTSPEPLPEGHPLYGHPRVSISPHISAGFPDLQARGLRRFVENLERFRTGRELIGRVDPTAGY